MMETTATHCGCNMKNKITLKVAGSSPDEVDVFNLPNSSSRAMTLGSTKSLTEMSIRNLPGGKGPPAHMNDNLTVICQPTV
jgi:hypothetical protein